MKLKRKDCSYFEILNNKDIIIKNYKHAKQKYWITKFIFANAVKIR